MSAIRVANYMAKEKAKEFLPKALITIAIILYIFNIGTNEIWFEIFSLVFVIFYCTYKLVIDGVKTDTGFTIDNLTKPITIFILFLESVLFIVFLSNNSTWLEETKKKPYQYKNFIDFLRIIFLAQILMLQTNLDRKQYPVIALNILLFVFWVTSFIILRHMLNTQKIH